MRLMITVQNSNNEDVTYAWFGEFLWTCVLSLDLMCSRLISTRSAEITSGIICSCFPVLPAFVRYFYGKATSRIYKSRDRRNDNSALFTYRESTIPSPTVQRSSDVWKETDDSRLLQRTYLELQERNCWDSWDVEGIPEIPEIPEIPATAMTTINHRGAGEWPETIRLPAVIQRSMMDLDLDRGGSTHRQEIRRPCVSNRTLAQYPKDLATLH